jgi:hypothetical protein
MIYWVEIIRKEMKTRVNQRKHPIEKHPSRTLFVDCYRWGKEVKKLVIKYYIKQKKGSITYPFYFR